MSSSQSTVPPGEAAPPEKKPFIGRPSVFVPAAILLIVFVALAAMFPDQLGEALVSAQDNVIQDISWWYVAVVTGFVFFSLWIALSPMGDIPLGKDGEEPEFKLGSWFSMLFAAGMGIGLVFWGVAEPLWFYGPDQPPGLPTDTEADAARTAMDVAFLHWGLHAWAIYVVVGLAVAYAVHRKGHPISLRYALKPLFGRHILGFWGDVVDVVAILGTLFGVATSLGLGVAQIGAGLGELGWISLDETTGSPTDLVQVLLIIVITAIALVSVVTGVDKGIKFLSNANMVLAVVLLMLVLFLGPTIFLLSDFVTQIGSYLERFLGMAFNVYPFQEDGGRWIGDWTTNYWGWWISWSPFVGVFIARISRGRTVREFVFGVLLVPTLVTFLWFSIMGGSAIYREMFGNGGLITTAEDGSQTVDSEAALFGLLEPLGDNNQAIAAIGGGSLLIFLAVILITIFFVTSSDSGSFVVDMLAHGGDPNPPVWSRAFWASMEGAVAVVLILAGGIAALQTAATLVAVPFSVIMVLMVVAVSRALLNENKVRQRERRIWLAERVAEHINEYDLIETSSSIPAVSEETGKPDKPEKSTRRLPWRR